MVEIHIQRRPPKNTAPYTNAGTLKQSLFYLLRCQAVSNNAQTIFISCNVINKEKKNDQKDLFSRIYFFEYYRTS